MFTARLAFITTMTDSEDMGFDEGMRPTQTLQKLFFFKTHDGVPYLSGRFPSLHSTLFLLGFLAHELENESTFELDLTCYACHANEHVDLILLACILLSAVEGHTLRRPSWTIHLCSCEMTHNLRLSVGVNTTFIISITDKISTSVIASTSFQFKGGRVACQMVHNSCMLGRCKCHRLRSQLQSLMLKGGRVACQTINNTCMR